MEKKAFTPDRILSYFKAEWKVLLVVTISGLIYNIGLLAGPWFEGKREVWCEKAVPVFRRRAKEIS